MLVAESEHDAYVMQSCLIHLLPLRNSFPIVNQACLQRHSQYNEKHYIRPQRMPCDQKYISFVQSGTRDW